MLRNVLFILIALLHTLSAAGQDRPNIVWIVSEDNSPYLGAYGDTLVNTPALDQFARQGVTYTMAFANAPVCAPSRSTLITGMYPPSLGSQHMRSQVSVRENVRFFPQYLKEAGYFTTLRLKRDYNIPGQAGTWDVDDWWNIEDAFAGRKEGQPYFMFYNTWMTHEGKIHDHHKKFDYFRNTFERFGPDSVAALLKQIHPMDPASVVLPPYLPDLPEVRRDLALYYELMQMLDMEFAQVLSDLAAKGQLENTIIIYSSDHGGVLGRSKRFAFESGLHVPLIIRFPEKYRHLSPAVAGAKTDRLVSFVDMAPTILNLAGVTIPPHMQGQPFLGPGLPERAAFAFGFRDRMDETYDMVRTIRHQQFRYIRNYHPHRPAGQRVNFLWQSANVRRWEEAFKNGMLNEPQSAFFQLKAPEELYDITRDPAEIHNLAGDPIYRDVLLKLRAVNDSLVRAIEDTGFIPEGELFAQFEATGTLYQDYVNNLPLEKIIAAAEDATLHPDAGRLKAYLKSDHPSIRYWGATGCLLLAVPDTSLREILLTALTDKAGDVRAVAAEALFRMGEKEQAIATFAQLLDDKNPFVVLRTANALEATRASSAAIREKVRRIAGEDSDGRFQYAKWKCVYLLTIL